MRRGVALVPGASEDSARVISIRCTGVVGIDGWRIKRYETAFERAAPRRELIDATTSLVHRLPQPPGGDGRDGVGFLFVDDGRERCLALLGWWTATELSQFAYVAPLDRPGDLVPVEGEGAGLAAALAVVSFERQAWFEGVVANPDGRDVERYLATRFEAVL